MTESGITVSTEDHIQVRVGERVAVWRNGAFYGDDDIVAEALIAAGIEREVDIAGTPVNANGRDSLGALAALWAYSPGHAEVMEAPDAVMMFLFPAEDDHASPDIMTVPSDLLNDEDED